MKTNLNITENRAVIYVCPITIGEETLSADEQLSAATEFAKGHGMTIVNTYIDAECAAAPDNRPQFQQMIIDGKQHMFDAVIVHNMISLSRNKLYGAFYKAILDRNSVEILPVIRQEQNDLEELFLSGVVESMLECVYSHKWAI